MSREQLQPRQNWMQYANLAFGVTTIHDPSNDNDAIFSMARAAAHGRHRGAAHLLHRTHSLRRAEPGATAKINRYEDAEFHVRRLQELGADVGEELQLPAPRSAPAGARGGAPARHAGGARGRHALRIRT
jgi:hypothetical protein